MFRHLKFLVCSYKFVLNPPGFEQRVSRSNLDAPAQLPRSHTGKRPARADC